MSHESPPLAARVRVRTYHDGQRFHPGTRNPVPPTYDQGRTGVVTKKADEVGYILVLLDDGRREFFRAEELEQGRIECAWVPYE